MNFKPEGLKLPDCECFRKKAKPMMLQINQLSAIHCLDVMKLGDAMQICPEARDYFVSVFIANLATLLIKKRDNDEGEAAVSYQADFEKVYDRIRPLVMQQLDYIDGSYIE